MKKIFVILLSICSLSLYSQKGVHVGAYGGLTGSMIMNQDTWGWGSEYDYDGPYFNGNYKFSLAYGINNSLSIKTEIGKLFLGQNYKDNINGSDYSRKIKYKYTTIALFISNKTKGKIGVITSAGILYAFNGCFNQEWTVDGKELPGTGTDLAGHTFSYSSDNVNDRFESNNIYIAFDLGMRINIIKSLYFDILLNGAYGFCDINSANFKIGNVGEEYKVTKSAFLGINGGIIYVFDLKKNK